MRNSTISLDAPSRKIPLVLLLALAVSGSGYGLDANRPVSQYMRDRWGTEQGFPRGPVYSIAQSNDGYLWIGTKAGLVRFDGLKFQLLRDAPGLANGESVLGLMPDGYGNLWIRTEGNLLRYRNGVFDHPIERIGSRITAMSEGVEGNLLVSVTGRGAMMFRHGKLQVIADANALPRSPVLSITQTADGSIWSGTRGGGLYRQHDGRSDPVFEGLPDRKVNCLKTDAKGYLWIGTDSGIVRWNGGGLSLVGPALLHRFQVLAIERDYDGNIWIGTDSHGLLRINEQGVTQLEAGLEQSWDAVTAVFEDREGNLWLGSDSGIERLRDTAFLTYSQPKGIQADRGSPLFVDLDNRVWFAVAGGGLCWMKDGHRGRVSNDGLDHDVIYSIAGSKRELWIGRQRGGLTRLRQTGRSFTAQTYTKTEGLAQNSVFSVYQARDGTVWAGTLNGGISQLRSGRFTTYTTTTGLLANTVACILEDSGGTTWFATPGGLNALSRDHWQRYTEKDGLPSNNVYSLLEDSAKVLWIGTSAGIAFRNGGRIQTPGGLPESLREPILGMAEDRYGSLWMSTSNHVLRVRRDRLLRGDLDEGDVRLYGTLDGLRGSQGVRRHPSVAADAPGHVWFSLDHAISVVQPERLMRNARPAISQVQTISVDGSAISLKQPVHVPGGRRRITLDYAGLGLSAPDLVRFRYRLDGYDSTWNKATSTREAAYTNLPPGAYRFRVVARNPDSGWNGNEAGIVFKVDPLLWQTRWFRGLALIVSFGIVVAFFRWRLQRLAKQFNLRFEGRLAERTRIARDLHDTLLQSFHGLIFRMQAARNLLLHRPEDACQQLDTAIARAEQAIAEGRNAIQDLRRDPSHSNDIAKSITVIAQILANAQESNRVSAAFRLTVEGERQALCPMVQDEIYRIAREVLRNAFQHAQADRIEAEIRYDNRLFRLRIRDDGRGIDPRILKEGQRSGHWGLPGIRERARQIGAGLDFWSDVGVGTEVELTVPSRVAYAKSSNIRRLKLFRKRMGTHGH